jgi:phage terminase Nu1 subunit (DNA packaging protein)
MAPSADELFYLKSDGSLSGGDYCRTEIIAKLFGVSVRRIQQLTQEGVLPTTQTKDGRRYDLIPTIQNYVKYLSEKARSKASGKSEREVQLREQKLEADIALKESQGELHRLRTEIASGKYIGIEEVVLDYSRFFVTFKRFAMSLPTRVSGMIGGAVDPLTARKIEKELQAEITSLLTSFVVAGITQEEAGRKKGKRGSKKATPPVS